MKDEYEEEELRKLHEAEMKKLSADQKGKDGFGFTQRLKKGDFTFDTYGKAMLVHKQNPSKLPVINSETNYKVKYPGVSSVDQSEEEAASGRAIQPKEVRVRPVTVGNATNKGKKISKRPVTEM